MSEFDLSTFSGRFMFYMNMTDPRTLIHSEAKVKESKLFVDAFEASGAAATDEYRQHKKICDAAIHPVTGEVIPRLFRVSCIAPVKSFSCALASALMRYCSDNRNAIAYSRVVAVIVCSLYL